MRDGQNLSTATARVSQFHETTRPTWSVREAPPREWKVVPDASRGGSAGTGLPACTSHVTHQNKQERREDKIEGGDGGKIVRVSPKGAHDVTFECTANGQHGADHLLVGERDVGVPTERCLANQQACEPVQDLNEN